MNKLLLLILFIVCFWGVCAGQTVVSDSSKISIEADSLHLGIQHSHKYVLGDFSEILTDGYNVYSYYQICSDTACLRREKVITEEWYHVEIGYDSLKTLLE